jgi:hypothetical protein
MSDAQIYPEGEYAIVELFGHTTLVGRIAETERFGTKMLAIEPLFSGSLLPAVFHGGAAIYRLTPCSPAVAWAQQPRRAYMLPPQIRCIVPSTLLESSDGATSITEIYEASDD